MRLLEPIQGLKVASNHYVVHLAFFIAMFFVNRDPNYLWPKVPEKKMRLLDGNESAINDTRRYLGGSSSSSGNSKEAYTNLTPEQLTKIKSDEFFKFQATHAGFFVFYLIFVACKQRHYYAVAQSI